MAVTIKELSAACGLSVSTVSKALNGYPDVSEKTREFVRETAAKLGYRPSAIARGLKLGRTFNLGVLYTTDAGFGFTHSYFSPVLEAFKEEAKRCGYDITFITHRAGAGGMTYLEHCLYRNVDGVCIVCSHFVEPEVLELMNGSLPVVTVDYEFPQCSCVKSENREGMEKLTRHILSKGHTRVACICGEENFVTDIRKDSFLRTMREAGHEVPKECIVCAKYHNPSAAREAARKLLAINPRPTCILMPDDYVALGVMEAILEAGLRIPQDISVTGYDGVSVLQLCSPRLTTVAQDSVGIGSLAARKLVQLIENPEITLKETITVPSRLIEGETVERLDSQKSEVIR